MGGENEIVLSRLNGEIAHRNRRETATLELGPGVTAINRDIETELGTQE